MDLEPTTPPHLYPIDEHDNLPLYESATFCSKLQCQALAAAAGVFWQKPFFAPVNNQTRFFARCYDPNCSFIMRFNRKIKSDGTSIIWTLNDIKEHNCTTRLSDKPKNPPYSKPLLKFAILDELMDASVSQQTLATKLRNFIGCQPSASLVSKVKRLGLQFLRGECTVRSIVRTPKIKSKVSDQTRRLFDYCDGLRRAGHVVEITTQPGTQLRQYVLTSAKKIHHERQLKLTPKNRTPFDPAHTSRSQFYSNIDPDQLYLYSIFICPTSAAQLHAACPKISQADFAHCKGVAGGNIFVRVCQDGNRAIVHLVLGYIAGNENEKAWTIANNFTRANLVEFDQRGQVDITDAQKGALSAAHAFQFVHHFMCSNHRSKNASKLGAEAKLRYLR